MGPKSCYNSAECTCLIPYLTCLLSRYSVSWYPALFEVYPYGLSGPLYGMNRTANRYSGISNTKTLLVAYTLSGFLSALGGIVVLARNGAAQPDYGVTISTSIILIVMLSGIILGAARQKSCLCLSLR